MLGFGVSNPALIMKMKITIDQVFIPKSKVASLVSVTQRDAASLAERRILQQEEVKLHIFLICQFLTSFSKGFQTFKELATGGGQTAYISHLSIS